MKTTFNLKTTEGRKAAVKALEENFIKAFIAAGIELCKQTVARIGRDTIYFYVYFNEDSGGEITFHSNNDCGVLRPRENSINFGCSGEFTPANKFSYWRTIHAASILKNWDAACAVVNEYCKKYVELEKEMDDANPVLVCNNCKKYWIAPVEKCSCGSTTLNKTDAYNAAYAENKK